MSDVSWKHVLILCQTQYTLHASPTSVHMGNYTLTESTIKYSTQPSAGICVTSFLASWALSRIKLNLTGSLYIKKKKKETSLLPILYHSFSVWRQPPASQVGTCLHSSVSTASPERHHNLPRSKNIYKMWVMDRGECTLLIKSLARNSVRQQLWYRKVVLSAEKNRLQNTRTTQDTIAIKTSQ